MACERLVFPYRPPPKCLVSELKERSFPNSFRPNGIHMVVLEQKFLSENCLHTINLSIFTCECYFSDDPNSTKQTFSTLSKSTLTKNIFHARNTTCIPLYSQSMINCANAEINSNTIFKIIG